MLEASVIVATHNGGQHLKSSLPALAPSVQGLSEDRYEVIVVDNASTDGTGEVALGLRSCVPNLRVVREDNPGLCHARNRGIAESRSPIVAFIDDDAAAGVGWVQAYLDLFRDVPRAASCGGPIDVRWLADKPAWWTDGLDEIFNRFDLGPRRRALRYPRLPIGTNMAYRRETFERVGGFDVAYGRAGGASVVGDESEIGLRIQRAGGVILYEPRARIEHFAYAKRMTKEYARLRAAAHAHARCHIDYRHLGFRRVPHQFARVTLGALRALARRRFGVEERLPFIYFASYMRSLARILLGREPG
ncbi:MAG: glycosyltransferase family 2 protein [Planctomycetota bacterium]|jgi:glycosyltransferase involved in cell wall biosynthesis